MLHRINGTYYFRRVVPSRIRDLVGKREIIISLKTSRRTEATAVAGMIYGHTESIFHAARAGTLTDKKAIQKRMQDVRLGLRRKPDFSQKLNLNGPDDAAGFVRHVLGETTEDDRELVIDDLIDDLREKLSKAPSVGDSQMSDFMRSQTEFNRQVVELLQQHKDKQSVPVQSPAPVSPIPQSEIMSVEYDDAVKQFLEFKQDEITADTYRQHETTFNLFSEACGNRRMHEYARTDATAFMDLIRSLPSKYRKAQDEKSMSLQQIIQKHRDKNHKYETLGAKSIQRHRNHLEGSKNL